MSDDRSGPAALPPDVFLRWTAVTLAAVVMLLSLVHSMTTGNRIVLLGLLVVPGVLLLVNRQGWWFALTVGFTHSWIYVPGFPTALSAFNLSAMAFLPVLLMGRLVKPPRFPEAWPLKALVLAYLVVVVVVMAVRGTGFRFLGDPRWGGAAYVNILIGGLLYLLCDRVIPTPRQVRWAVILYLGAVMAPALAEMVFLLSRGTITAHYSVIRPDDMVTLGSLRTMYEGGVMRFQLSKQIALMATLALALWPFRGRYIPRIVMAFAFAVALVGISGHRSGMLYLLGLVPAVIVLSKRRFPFRRVALYVAGLVAVMAVLAAVGERLPLSVQRGLSWLPFAEVSWEAQDSALRTTRWRFDLWSRTLAMLPDYWLVGRGFAFESAHLLWLHVSPFGRHNVEWALITHNYHSGPISLLIDLGIPGLAAGSLLIVCGFVKQYRRLSESWADASLARMHTVLLASYLVEVFRFYLVMGDAAQYVVLFMVRQMLMDAIYRADRSVRGQRAEVTP